MSPDLLSVFLSGPSGFYAFAALIGAPVIPDEISPEIYFPAIAVASCIILFGFILIYILRAGSTVRRSSENSSPERFNDFFNQSEVGIGVIDNDGFLVLSNLPLQEITGYTGTQLSTISFRSLFADRDDYVEPSKVAGMLDKFGESHQVFLRQRSGDLLRVRFLVLPAPDSVYNNADILLLEAASHNGGGGQATDADESLQKAKDTFFESLNNDLKNPLTVILGSAALLAEEGHYSPELVQSIISSGKRLLNELDGLLLLASSTQDRLPDKPFWFSVRSAIGEIISDYQRQLNLRGLRFDTSSVNEINVDLDAAVFHRLINLVVDCAIHSARDTEIHVSAATAGSSLQIELKFSKKSPRIDLLSTREAELAIASRLASTLGGTMSFDESAHAASSVVLSLPVGQGVASQSRHTIVRAA